MKNMMKIMLVVSMGIVGGLEAAAGRLTRGVGQALKNVRFNSSAAEAGVTDVAEGFGRRGLNTQKTAGELSKMYEIDAANAAEARLNRANTTLESQFENARSEHQALDEAAESTYSQMTQARPEFNPNIVDFNVLPKRSLFDRIRFGARDLSEKIIGRGKNTTAGVMSDAQVGQQEINAGIMQNLKNVAANENLQAAGAAVGLTGAGLAAGTAAQYASDVYDQMQEENAIAQQEALVSQGLQEIDQQMIANEAQIVELQNRLDTESSVLTTAEQADLQNQIRALQVENMNFAEGKNNLEGEFNSDMQGFDSGMTTEPVSRLQRAKNALHDYAGVYVNRFGNYVGNTLSNVWQGFRTLNVKDQMNLLVEGMKSMTSTAAGLPKATIAQLKKAYVALMQKVRRDKKAAVAPVEQSLEQSAMETPTVTVDDQDQTALRNIPVMSI